MDGAVFMFTPKRDSRCVVRRTQGKGRGVFASLAIPAHTVIEIDPVLIFDRDEYEAHGRHTVLDHYPFKWRNGQMALALGLGSIFNHADPPNVSFTLDFLTDSIRYTTTRDILPDEELCIFYGHKLWFTPLHEHPPSEANIVADTSKEETGDAWGGLFELGSNNETADEDMNEIVAEEELPFTKPMRRNPEEDENTMRTVQAWVVDIPDPKQIPRLLKWLKQSELESEETDHLKRVRKRDGKTTLLLSISLSSPPPPPPDLQLPEPYAIQVPETAALTRPLLELKASLWPTIFAPQRKNVAPPWTRGKIRWAQDAFQKVVEEAAAALAAGELPIAAYVPILHEGEASLPTSFIARDTRISTGHPLRHAVINVIRQVADYRTATSTTSLNEPSSDGSSSPRPVNEARNGTNYLLTSLAVFTSHEPCIMCSMALLHSRVKEVFYAIPMGKTGGCGGLACLPTLEGVNHRYSIYTWKEDRLELEKIRINEDTDA